MKASMVIVCVLTVSAYARSMPEIHGSAGGNPRIGISSGYGAAYGNYGDYTGYESHSAPISSSWAKIPAYVYTPSIVSYDEVNVQKQMVDAPLIVNVHEVKSVTQVVPVKKAVTTLGYSTGYSGYGSGVSSGYFGYSGHAAYSDRASHHGYPGLPRYSGYASGWW